MGRIRVFLAVFVILWMVVIGPLSITGWLSNPAVLGLALGGIVVLSIATTHYHAKKSDTEDGGFWNRIPERQYEGRFVEVGGLSRDEQGNAIETIHERAGELGNVRDRK